MYDYSMLDANITYFFGIGTFMLLLGIWRFFKKSEENKISWLVCGIFFFIFFGSFGIAEINAAINPEIEFFTGEFYEKKTTGSGSTQDTRCCFNPHDGSSKLGFNAADIEYFLVPEKGKWYEIHYVKNSTQRAVVNVIEIETPKYINYDTENQEIKTYIGEFIEKNTFGDSIEYGFNAYDGTKTEWFYDEEIEYFLIPESEKWYEILYIKKTKNKTIVGMTEIEPPEYVEETN